MGRQRPVPKGMTKMAKKRKRVVGGLKYLVCVDGSHQSKVAVRFACLRARNTGGRVALLHVIPPAEFQHWMAVEDAMQKERRQETEKLLQDLAAEVNEWAGIMPELFVRDGELGEQILALLEEDTGINALVVGAAPPTAAHGELISWLASELAGSLRIPLTIVPGNLTDDQIVSLT